LGIGLIIQIKYSYGGEATMADENIGEVATGAAVNNTDQAKAKTYTQEEVDSMMARTRASLEKKLLKPFEDLGDPAEIREVLKEHQKRQQEAQLKRGEWEKTLQDIVGKKDAEISKRDAIIKEYKINTPLISAASKLNAVNAEQVKALLINQVRLNESGEVEVVDGKGSVRYKDSGKIFEVDDLVKEFLDTNPHFRSANPTTTATKTNIASRGTQLDITKLDMRNPDDRARYKEYRKAQGLT
jgi:hypothetical protein